MNLDEVLEMARQAGAEMSRPLAPHEFSIHAYSFREEQLERFAALVAERTREECADVKIQVKFNGMTAHEFALNELYKFQEATGCDIADEIGKSMKAY